MRRSRRDVPAEASTGWRAVAENPQRPKLRGHKVPTFLAALISIILIAISFSAAPQSGGWQLGRYALLTSEASSGPLLQRASGRSSLLRYGFVGKVGGIAFEGVAALAPSLQEKQLSLTYDSNRPDGQRLIIAIDGETYVQSIYDWMLIPIVNYANSDYNAVVSLFGEKTTEDTYDIVYHPAFENTLLGIRLLQADIIFFDLGETWQLPKLEGQTILGAGETLGAGEDAPKYRARSAGCSHLQVIEAAAPAENSRFDVAVKLHEILAQQPFQSWVMTDQETPVIVELQDGHLLLRGSPYYFFWKSDFDEYKRELDELKREAATARAEGNVLRHNEIVERANHLEPRVTEVESITRELRQKLQLLRDFNPTVYAAATTVVQYSALFRLIKLENRQNWEEFLTNTRGVQTTPSVQTPTRWVKPVSPRHPQRVHMTPPSQSAQPS